MVSDPSEILNEFDTLIGEEKFLAAITAALHQWSDMRIVSERLHQQVSIFEGLDDLIIHLKDVERMKEYNDQLEQLRNLIRLYGSVIKVLAPRVGVLLKYAVIFVINGMASKNTSKIVLDDKDIKRLSTVYTSIILNLTANSEWWLGHSGESDSATRKMSSEGSDPMRKVEQIPPSPSGGVSSDKKSGLVLVEWGKEMEKGRVDRETFAAFHSYLRNKF